MGGGGSSPPASPFPMALKQSHPRCKKRGKRAKMRTVKNLLKPSNGRPFFVCSDQSNPCSFWAWGDVRPIAKLECRHGFPCVIRKVKKDGINKERLFFCCAQENSCKLMQPKNPDYDAKFFRPVTKQDEKHEEQYLTKDFINDLASLKI